MARCEVAVVSLENIFREVLFRKYGQGIDHDYFDPLEFFDLESPESDKSSESGELSETEDESACTPSPPVTTETGEIYVPDSLAHYSSLACIFTVSGKSRGEVLAVLGTFDILEDRILRDLQK